jgi:membrane protease YdiL (CAAX protease family)
MANKPYDAMTASFLTKSALMGAFCFYLVLSLSLEIRPDLAWLVRQPLNALVLIVISPALEEWIFRGWIFDWVRESKFGRATVGQDTRWVSNHNVISTVCFCALHGVLREPLTGLLVLAPSLLLGAMRDRQVSLPVLMGIHGTWNFGWFLFFPPD